MPNYRANPEEAHKEFQNFVDKIASCVSSKDVRRVTNILKVTDELGNHYGDLLSKAMSAQMKELWTSIDLDQKLKKLHELEKENTGQAWRPQTDMSDIQSIEGEHLRKQIKKMEKNIEQSTKESSQLQTEIAVLRQEIQEQLVELKKPIQISK